VNEILSFNETTIRKIFKLYLHPNKQYITNKECVQLIYKLANIKLPEMTITQCFAQTKLSLIDPVINQKKMQEMRLFEFFEFLGRIAFEWDQYLP
jgi:hypothetical protein